MNAAKSRAAAFISQIRMVEATRMAVFDLHQLYRRRVKRPSITFGPIPLR
jgi:hypothetical protein